MADQNYVPCGLTISIEAGEIVSFAAVHNGAPVLREIIITNAAEEPFENLVLRVSSDSGIIGTLEQGIARIGPGEELHLKNPGAAIDAGALAARTERSMERVSAAVFRGGEMLCAAEQNLTVLAFDQWTGSGVLPEILASFVMPNHPGIMHLLQQAAGFIGSWTGDPSLAGYQMKDPNRVKQMAAAAYAAIAREQVIYAEPPASFEESGQRIRLPDVVLGQRFGTCMDMTLLYAGCLEAMGLNPFLVMMKGHIFAGVWLCEQSFPDMLLEDPSQIEKRMSRGIHELLCVECTAMCAGRDVDFDRASGIAAEKLSDYDSFVFALDIGRARSMGVRPLPVRVMTPEGYRILEPAAGTETVRDPGNQAAPGRIGDTFLLPEGAGTEEVSKQTQWERKLLDLSLRNMLINLRMTRSVVPILTDNIGTLEDALSDGEEFRILPKPADLTLPEEGGAAEALSKLGSYAEYIALESRHKRLHAVYGEKELEDSLTKMYRQAKTSLEENGASTLYMALGLLRWYEDASSETARYAPVVLLPIEIVRKAAGKGYGLRMRDEEAQVNITLLEFLKQNYGIHVPGLNPPPSDEHGLDIPRIFAIIRRTVMNLRKWDVIEAGFVGNFAFSQFVMWNDIHNRTEFLDSNKIVHSLMTGAIDWDTSVPESVDTEEPFLPVTADASQLRAINMASAGVSFVLHGPPGTGKSQTITGMIANALTRGRTVLFVAEKMAALEVVRKRLNALGIRDFCLELHSHKATKKSVLDQLRRGLEDEGTAEETNYGSRVAELGRMRAELDAYAGALHRMRPFGQSLSGLMELYESVPETGTDIRFDHRFAASLTEEMLTRQFTALERMTAAGRAVGHPCGHALSAVRKHEYSQRLKFDLGSILGNYRAALTLCRDDAASFAETAGFPAPSTRQELQNLREFAECLPAVLGIPAFLRGTADPEPVFAPVRAFVGKKEAYGKRRSSLLGIWNENFLRQDMSAYRTRYEQAGQKFFGKGRALSALTQEIQAFANFKAETEKIPLYLSDVAYFQEETARMEADEAALPAEWKEILDGLAAESGTSYGDGSMTEAFARYERDIRSRLSLRDRYAAQLSALDRAGRIPMCTAIAENMLADMDALERAEMEADSLLDLSFPDGGDYIGTRLALCGSLAEEAGSLKDWIIFRSFEKDCLDLGLAGVVAAYEGGIAHEDVLPAFKRSIYRTMILSIIEDEPVLNSFTGAGFEEKIAQFKRLDAEFMELTRKEMVARLTAARPKPSDSVEISRELNILRRAITSNGRGISVRSLFEQIPEVLAKLTPCMLMSPISVAQYLAARNDLFDIVIFDEASQLPTCKAVGVLARGRNAVIVGDPNQMPPTSFFAGSTVDEDNLDIEDLDSILDDCLALGMPESHLRWHYRSRHESLIAFSNREFYENAMFTFPSPGELERHVKLVRVDGVFDRGRSRTNRAEADAVAAELLRRYKDESLRGMSVGVVTFNIQQQALVEDLVQKACREDEGFDAWVNSGEEPLFVKNLENVQGDERDVILFSVAFGPDRDGRLSLNFGPLNKDGGWKRLNVAVSRARSDMVVFTGLTAEMIDLRRTRARGVEALRDFLAYAEHGRLDGEEAAAAQRERAGIAGQICRKLTEAGWAFETGVGHSRFKVDIAVIDPRRPGEYLLGILLDGGSYRQSVYTRDREVSQIGVLRGLGWTIHRVWTMDWWDRPEREMARILDILEQYRTKGDDNGSANCIKAQE